MSVLFLLIERVDSKVESIVLVRYDLILLRMSFRIHL
jgi:hypothetical protein